MELGRSRSGPSTRGIGLGTLLLALGATLIAPGAAAPAPTATITVGPFTDSCRDVSFHSTKDISHVEIHYSNPNREALKDETVASPNYRIDGDPGDEIDFVIVKSGKTTETFACPATNSPPTALLEIKTPTIDHPTAEEAEECTSLFSPPDLYCSYGHPRTVWTPWEPGAVFWLFCPEQTFTFSFRGTSSTDPDGDIDIASWSIAFGDGTTASGSWATDSPTEVVHEYSLAHFLAQDPTTVTLTVTDSADQSDSDTLSTGLVNACPD